MARARPVEKPRLRTSDGPEVRRSDRTSGMMLIVPEGLHGQWRLFEYDFVDEPFVSYATEGNTQSTVVARGHILSVLQYSGDSWSPFDASHQARYCVRSSQATK
jgi:hypothetical protein